MFHPKMRYVTEQLTYIGRNSTFLLFTHYFGDDYIIKSRINRVDSTGVCVCVWGGIWLE